MTYKLTLTSEERKAFDFVGNRYSNGTDMSNLLCQFLSDDLEWNSTKDITFDLPEHIAWQLLDLAKQDDESFPCFSESLTLKMLSFLEQIV